MTTTHAGPGPHLVPRLVHALAENWWLHLLRGVFAILFGVLAFMWPGMTLLSLAILWGVYTFADGFVALWAAIAGKATAGARWWLLFIGVLGLAAGAIAFVWPSITAFVLVMLIAAWSVIGGVVQILGAIAVRKEVDNEWWLMLGGAASVLFGVLVFSQPGAGAVSIVWLIATFAILFGALNVMFALRLRKLKDV